MIRVELIAIRIRWTVIPTVDNAVPIVIITDISEPVAILVRLHGMDVDLISVVYKEMEK
jgi:hypothetical protein